MPGDSDRPQARRQPTSSTCSQICSSCVACLAIFARITAQSYVAKIVQAWITGVGAKTAYITPGSPWENGYVDKLQRTSSRRTPERARSSTHSGNAGRHRKLATSLQRRAPACLFGIPAAGQRRCSMPAFSAWPAALARPTPHRPSYPWRERTHRALTLPLDHLVGADQGCPWISESTPQKSGSDAPKTGNHAPK